MGQKMSSENTCCPPGSWGELLPNADDSSYEPKGEEIKLRDDEIKVYYVTNDEPSEKVVFVFTDV